MEIKVYILEFTYFDACIWGDTTIEITAETKIQLIKAFLNETTHLHKPYSFGEKLTQKEMVKEVWNKNKKYIEEEILKFPIVKTLD